MGILMVGNPDLIPVDKMVDAIMEAMPVGDELAGTDSGSLSAMEGIEAVERNLQGLL